jgi:hypothetical protein
MVVVAGLTGLIMLRPCSARADAPTPVIELSDETPETAAPVIELSDETPETAAPVIELSAVDEARPLGPGTTYPAVAAGGSCLEGGPCLSYKEAFKLALSQEPGIGSAKARLISGIVLTSVAGAAALITGFVALIAAMAEDWSWGYDEYDSGYDSGYGHGEDHTARNYGIASLSCLVLAVAVGVPVLVSGASELRKIRRRVRRRLGGPSGDGVPVVGVVAGGGRAGLSARWSF